MSYDMTLLVHELKAPTKKKCFLNACAPQHHEGCKEVDDVFDFEDYIVYLKKIYLVRVKLISKLIS